MEISKEYDGCYILLDNYNTEVGRIIAKFHGNTVEIDSFCVALKYRGRKQRYGKHLLDKVVLEAKMRGIVCIYVTPKAEEIYDDVEPMDLQKLYRKYKNLGFRFKDEKLRDYGNVMQMDLI